MTFPKVEASDSGDVLCILLTSLTLPFNESKRLKVCKVAAVCTIEIARHG